MERANEFKFFIERKAELEQKARSLSKEQIEELKKIARGELKKSREEIEEARYLLYLLGIEWDIAFMIAKIKERLKVLDKEINKKIEESEKLGLPTSLEKIEEKIQRKTEQQKGSKRKKNTPIDEKQELDEIQKEIKELKQQEGKISEEEFKEKKLALTLKLLEKENPQLAELLKEKAEKEKLKTTLLKDLKEYEEKRITAWFEYLKKEAEKEKKKQEFYESEGFFKTLKNYIGAKKAGISKTEAHWRTVAKYYYLENGRPDLAFGGDAEGLIKYIKGMQKKGQDITKIKWQTWENPICLMALEPLQAVLVVKKGPGWEFVHSLANYPFLIYKGIPHEILEKHGILSEEIESTKKYPRWAGSSGIIRFILQKALSSDAEGTIEKMWQLTPDHEKEELQNIFLNSLAKMTPKEVTEFDVGAFRLKIKQEKKEAGWEILKDGTIKDPKGNIWVYNPDREEFFIKENPGQVAKAEEIIDTGSSFWIVGRHIAPSQLGDEWTEESIFVEGKPEMQNELIQAKNYFVNPETRKRAALLEKKGNKSEEPLGED